MIIEQRKYARFLPPSQAFAALGSTYTRVGKVKNISLGGLAFEYIIGEETNSNFSRIDIFLVGDVFHLYNVPCKMVYDIQIHVPYVNNTFIKKLTTKRCGIKFDGLSEDAITQLEFFLEAHTEGISI